MLFFIGVDCNSRVLLLVWLLLPLIKGDWAAKKHVPFGRCLDAGFICVLQVVLKKYYPDIILFMYKVLLLYSNIAAFLRHFR
jgi:hypothetical protein